MTRFNPGIKDFFVAQSYLNTKYGDVSACSHPYTGGISIVYTFSQKASASLFIRDFDRLSEQEVSLRLLATINPAIPRRVFRNDRDCSSSIVYGNPPIKRQSMSPSGKPETCYDVMVFVCDLITPASRVEIASWIGHTSTRIKTDIRTLTLPMLDLTRQDLLVLGVPSSRVDGLFGVLSLIARRPENVRLRSSLEQILSKIDELIPANKLASLSDDLSKRVLPELLCSQT